MLRIGYAVFTGNVLIGAYTLEIAAVNLYTRLVGKHLHEDTCLGTVKAGTNLSIITLTVFICVQTEVVVVACSVLDLIKTALNAVANGVWSTEIHWSSLY